MTETESGAADGTANTDDAGPLDISTAKLAHDIGDVILEKKGFDLIVINVEKVTTLADYLVIATGHSARQVLAMAKDTREQIKLQGIVPVSEEGMDEGWWVLMDFGDVILHIMQEDARRYYDLEALWGDGRVVRRAAAPEETEGSLDSIEGLLPLED